MLWLTVILPVLTRLWRVIGGPKLVDPTMNHEKQADGSKGWRNDENQNPAAQCLDHARARGSPLRITEGTVLGESRKRRCQEQCGHCQHSHQSQPALNTHSSPRRAVTISTWPKARLRAGGNCRSTHIACRALPLR